MLFLPEGKKYANVARLKMPITLSCFMSPDQNRKGSILGDTIWRI